MSPKGADAALAKAALSAEALDLVRGLLRAAPDERLRAHHAANHAFLRSRKKAKHLATPPRERRAYFRTLRSPLSLSLSLSEGDAMKIRERTRISLRAPPYLKKNDAQKDAREMLSLLE